MNLFRVCGIQLSVHFSFFLLLAAFGWSGWEAAGWRGMTWLLGTALAFFTCVVLHEFGHSFAAMHFGVNVRRILLLPIGGMAEFDSIPRQPRRELLITVAGPAVNFAIAAVLWLFVPPYDSPIADYSFPQFLYELLVLNVAMGVFNLVPAFPMDGGRIFRALLATRLPYLRATRIAASVGKVFCTAGFVFALTAPLWHVSESPLWLLALLFAFIFVVGELEYRMLRRREADEARWRVMLRDLRALPSPGEEPPLIRR